MCNVMKNCKRVKLLLLENVRDKQKKTNNIVRSRREKK